MQKVIPRDLFNDGNLLTNYGHLYICLSKIGLQHLLINSSDDKFEILMDPSNGATSLINVSLITVTGKKVDLFRPLNSREKYSLMFMEKDDDYDVFNFEDDELKLNKILVDLLKGL